MMKNWIKGGVVWLALCTITLAGACSSEPERAEDILGEVAQAYIGQGLCASGFYDVNQLLPPGMGFWCTAECEEDSECSQPNPACTIVVGQDEQPDGTIETYDVSVCMCQYEDRLLNTVVSTYCDPVRSDLCFLLRENEEDEYWGCHCGDTQGGCDTDERCCAGSCVPLDDNCQECGAECNASGAGASCNLRGYGQTVGTCDCDQSQVKCDDDCHAPSAQRCGPDCNDCGTGSCSDGGTPGDTSDDSCVCGTGEALCSGSCVDTDTDPGNCGSCGFACPNAGEVCVSGSCQCPTGQTACGGTCVDTDTDENHCGGCHAPCAAGETCTGGICAACFSNAQCMEGQICDNSVGQCTTVAAGAKGSACTPGANFDLDNPSCASGFKSNGTNCVDTCVDSSNCGAVGQICPYSSVPTANRVCCTTTASGNSAQCNLEVGAQFPCAGGYQPNSP